MASTEKCDYCESTELIVTGDSGNACLVHYPEIKRGKAVPHEVTIEPVEEVEIPAEIPD